MHLIRRKTCHVCDSSVLKKAIDSGEQNLRGSFVKPGKELPPLSELEPVRCDPMRNKEACGLI
jgi:hypothetical protein